MNSNMVAKSLDECACFQKWGLNSEWAQIRGTNLFFHFKDTSGYASRWWIGYNEGILVKYKMEEYFRKPLSSYHGSGFYVVESLEDILVKIPDLNIQQELIDFFNGKQNG